jgi:hypothetical protein
MNALSLARFLMIGVFAASLYASPIQYNIAFSGGSPTPTSGSFTYDDSTTQFSSFLVSWHGATFDLTISANSPLGSNGCTATTAQLLMILTGTGVCAGANTIRWFANIPFSTQGTFGILDAGTGIGPPSVGLAAQTSSVNLAQIDSTFGSFVATQVTQTPEPATMVLTCGGIAILAFARRRRQAVAR